MTSQGRARDAGAVVAEFALLAGVTVVTILAVVQLAVFLFQRNVVVASLSEGARVAAGVGRGAQEGRDAACALVRRTIGDRCRSLGITASEPADRVEVSADGSLPPLLPGLPSLRVSHRASMGDEDDLYPGVPG